MQTNGAIPNGTNLGLFTITYAGTGGLDPSINGGADKELGLDIFSAAQTGQPMSVTLTFAQIIFGFGADFSSPSTGGGANITINAMTILDFGAGIGGGIGFRGFTDATGFTSLTFTAGSGNSFGETFAADNIRITTPEPTTLALMGLALAGLGFQRRKAA